LLLGEGLLYVLVRALIVCMLPFYLAGVVIHTARWIARRVGEACRGQRPEWRERIVPVVPMRARR
jgi:hypothetical protein